MNSTQLRFSKPQQKTWKAPDGKSIPYTQTEAYLGNDGWTDWSITISVWLHNTSLEVVSVCGECTGDEASDHWVSITPTRIAKLPHAEFALRRQELIQKAIEISYRL